MINGIPNNDVVIGNARYSDTKQKIDAILGCINVTLDEGDYELKTFEISDEKPTHAAKLIFKDTKKKQPLIDNAKNLKDNEHFGNVFIRNDQTKLARKENFRLREKARELRSVNASAVIKIEKGKILQDSVVVDQYNISNQIFC